MAHNENKVLDILLSMLDYPNNDIYLHIDARASLKTDIDLKCATLHLIDRQKVTWGGTAIMNTMLRLMEESSKTHHDYYHFLSGVDLPIQKQEDIQRFFEENNGKEFLCMDYAAIQSGNFLHRVKYYHLKPSENKKVQRFLNYLQPAFNHLQDLFRIDRTKKSSLVFKKGESWFDLTEGFILYALDKMRNDPEYIRSFKSTTLCDEVFLPTLLMASPYKESQSDIMLHYTDWTEGCSHPATLDLSYLDTLKNSSCLYARKFSCHDCSELVDRIYALYK